MRHIEAVRGPAIPGCDTTRDTECAATRAALADYLRYRLLPGRGRRLEDHLVGCVACMRVFVDVRESAWTSTAAATTTRRAALARAS
ncbi:hypothetical protein [Promicromonospora sp. NPDC050880]|uniref:hypothetical protein n=1 Tax=Promicromonospora sp. NPDC050880 TaxID=3364406 RepID=UPI00379EED81